MFGSQSNLSVTSSAERGKPSTPTPRRASGQTTLGAAHSISYTPLMGASGELSGWLDKYSASAWTLSALKPRWFRLDDAGLFFYVTTTDAQTRGELLFDALAFGVFWAAPADAEGRTEFYIKFALITFLL